MALKALDLVPGYYRDHKIAVIEELRKEIHSKILLPVELKDDKRELPKSKEWSINFMNNTARGIMLRDAVKAANDVLTFPHIAEFGGGDFTFCIGMHATNLKFTYRNFGFSDQAILELQKIIHPWYDLRDWSHTYFVAYEIIEHLADITEIRQVYSRLKNVEKVFLSTPKYCYGEGTDWRKDGIHHRRTFTPREFQLACIDMFPEFEFKFVDDPVMVMVGSLRE